MGLPITIVLVIACYFLFRSMLRHLARVPKSFDNDGEPGLDATAPTPVVPAVPAVPDRVTPQDR